MPGAAYYAIEVAKHRKDDDPPWDPGDESAQPDKTVTYSFNPAISGGQEYGFLLAKKDDPPWDPGDESDTREAANVKSCQET
jgi:hypothetical protein